MNTKLSQYEGWHHTDTLKKVFLFKKFCKHV